jgi:hypothetical protein
VAVGGGRCFFLLFVTGLDKKPIGNCKALLGFMERHKPFVMEAINRRNGWVDLRLVFFLKEGELSSVRPPPPPPVSFSLCKAMRCLVNLGMQ